MKKSKSTNLMPIFMTFFTLYILKLLSVIGQYKPILDDYIQFKVYKDIENPFKNVILDMGLLNARPLAGFFDVYLWGNFFDNLLVVQIAIGTMWFITIFLLYRLFNRYLNVSPFFMVFPLFSPILVEGLYWVSASSRIVVSMFFMSVALEMLYSFSNKKELYKILLFWFFNLISLCFYEQTAAISFFITIILIILQRKRINPRIILLPILNLILIAIDYLFVNIGGEMLNTRMDFVALDKNIVSHFGNVINQLNKALFDVSWHIYKNAFKGGITHIYNNSFLYLLAIIMVCITLGVLYFKYKTKVSMKNSLITLGVGFLLSAVAAFPFFMLQVCPITLRTIVPLCVGISLILTALFDIILGRFYFGKGVVCALICLIFVVGSIYEMTTYNISGANDEKILNRLYEKVEGTKKGDKVLLFNTEEYAQSTSNYYEHIYSIASSDWALTGGIYALNGSKDIATIVPVSTNAIKGSKDKLINLGDIASNTKIIGVVEGELIDITLEKQGSAYAMKDDKGNTIWLIEGKQ